MAVMDETHDFHRVAKAGEIPSGEGKAFTVGEHLIGLFFVDEQYYAISDLCPHQGASLSAGHVSDGAVMCPWHAWAFRLEDGAWCDAPNSPTRCESYPVRVEGDEILIGIPKSD